MDFYRFNKKWLRPRTEWLLAQVVVLFWLIVIAITWAAIDFGDFGIWAGQGWFTRSEADVFVNFISALLLFLTFIVAFKTNTETQKQTELLTRPYLRVAWANASIPDDRSEQGIIHACVTLINEGQGLMREVHYTIKVGNKLAQVRNHALISPKRGATAVAYLEGASEHIIGVRKRDLDQQTLLKNGEIIKNAHKAGGICIEGYYKDLTDHTYPFHFILDPSEQSWFSEKHPQKRED